MLEVGIPVPALAEQIEAAVAANNKAAHGAGQVHLLVGGDVGPVRTERHGRGGRIGRRTTVRHGASAGRREQTGLQQIGVVAANHDATLGRVALRRGVLGTADAVVHRGVNLRIRRKVIGHAGIEVAAGQRVREALGELMGVGLVARIRRRAEAGRTDRTVDRHHRKHSSCPHSRRPRPCHWRQRSCRHTDRR